MISVRVSDCYYLLPLSGQVIKYFSERLSGVVRPFDVIGKVYQKRLFLSEDKIHVGTIVHSSFVNSGWIGRIAVLDVIYTFLQGCYRIGTFLKTLGHVLLAGRKEQHCEGRKQ